MITVRLYSTDFDGGYTECGDIYVAALRLTDGIPCDSFELTLPYTKEAHDAARGAKFARVLLNGEVLLSGVPDEVEAVRDEKGTRLELNGRGMAVLMMECECAGAEFERASFADVRSKYIAPCGVKAVDAGDMGSVTYYTVQSGTSCWRAVCDFCGWSAKLTPHFAPDGTLVLRPDGYNAGLLTLDGAAPVISARLTELRRGIVSSVVVTERVTSQSLRRTNTVLANAGHTASETIVAPNRRLSAYVPRADWIMHGEQRRWRTAKVVLAGIIKAYPCDEVKMALAGFPAESYRVSEVTITADARDSYTALTLRAI